MTTPVHDARECEVCGNTDLALVMDLGAHPLCDDLVRVGERRVWREYPIEVLFCGVCRTAIQRFRPPKEELFPPTYHYRARFTADVLDGMLELVNSCERRFGDLRGKRVVDIGCNDGSLLTFFAKKGALTIGIEPTDAYRDAESAGHATYNGFFSEELARKVEVDHGRPDLMTFTNVFAHIEDFEGLVRAVRALAGPQTIVVIENHYLGAVLDRRQFDTFYHEHARTYSGTSFFHIALLLGMRVCGIEFPSRYGGNIRVFLAGSGGPVQDEALQRGLESREAGFLKEFESLNHDLEEWRQRKRAQIASEVSKHGPLPAKAFPGRAAILMRLLGLDAESIQAVYEKPGSKKIGNYVPGTRIPIRSDLELFAMARDGRPLINLAWHIPGEIRNYLAANGYEGPVIDIVEPGDFRPPKARR